MTETTDRDLIRAAMTRLLTGKPIRSDGALNVVSLAKEANVKRHYLTHKHTDLRDDFYASIRAQGSVPESEKRLRGDLETTQERLRNAKEEIVELKAQVRTLLRMTNVLSVENAALRRSVEGGRERVSPIRRPPSI